MFWNKKYDEREVQLSRKSDHVAVCIGGIFCVGLVLLEFIISNTLNYGLTSVLFIILGIMDICDCKIDKRRWLLVKGIIKLMISKCCLILFIYYLVR